MFSASPSRLCRIFRVTRERWAASVRLFFPDERPALGRQYPGNVANQPSSGYMRHAVNPKLPDDIQHRLDINEGGLQQLLTQGPSSPGYFFAEAEPALLQEYFAHRRKPLLCSPLDAMPTRTSPVLIADPSMIFRSSTTPTANPARSYSFFA